MTREEREEAIERIMDIGQDVRAFCDGMKHMSEKDRKDLKALNNAIEALKQDPCEDCISREAVENALLDYSNSCDVNYEQIMKYIEKLPPVQPKQGAIIHSKWIGDKDYPICVNCGCNVYEEYIACSDYAHICKPMEYCPRCGATMNKENKEW